MGTEGENGCCTYPRGFRCTIIWAIALSCIGLLWAVFAGVFWAWITGIVSVVVISVMACVRQAKALAIVGAVFSFLSFLLMAIAAIVIGLGNVCLYSDDDYYDYYYSEGLTGCEIFAVVAGLGSLVWIAPGIICINLACKLGRPDDDDEEVARAVPVDVEEGKNKGSEAQ